MMVSQEGSYSHGIGYLSFFFQFTNSIAIVKQSTFIWRSIAYFVEVTEMIFIWCVNQSSHSHILFIPRKENTFNHITANKKIFYSFKERIIHLIISQLIRKIRTKEFNNFFREIYTILRNKHSNEQNILHRYEYCKQNSLRDIKNRVIYKDG